jgi:hypothetical protein
VDVWCLGANSRCCYRCRRLAVTTLLLQSLVVLVIVDHDAQNIQRILAFVEKGEEILS